MVGFSSKPCWMTPEGTFSENTSTSIAHCTTSILEDLEWTIKGTDPIEVKQQKPCQETRSKMQTAWKFPQGSWTWHGDFFGIVFCCLCKSASQGMQFLKDIVTWIAARFLCVLRWPGFPIISASRQWMLHLFQAVTLVTKQHFSPIASPFSRDFFDCWMFLLISLHSVASKQLRHVVCVCVLILCMSAKWDS